MSSILNSTGILPFALQPHVIEDLESRGIEIFGDRTDPYIKIQGTSGELIEIYLIDILGAASVPIVRGDL
jgi:hypothetical protein